MIRFIIASGTALAISGTVYLTVPTLLDDMPAKEFARMNGISEIVYDCAFDVLQDKNVEELVQFIEVDAVAAADGEFSETAALLRECVYLDPLGWHGTENEWAIELLEIDKWER